MNAKKGSKKKGKGKKPRQKTLKWGWILGGFVLIAGIVTGIVMNSQKEPEPRKKRAKVIAAKPGKVKPENVCMVNDQYMGVKQIPIVADGKTYYGCCENCVARIKNNSQNVRYAVDPQTGQKVDKSNAYVVLRPGASKKVWYFQSKENYRKFRE